YRCHRCTLRKLSKHCLVAFRCDNCPISKRQILTATRKGGIGGAMTGIEKKIRLLTIQEEIEHNDSKIAALQAEDIHGADRYRLERVSWYLQQAAQTLNAVSFTERP